MALNNVDINTYTFFIEKNSDTILTDIIAIFFFIFSGAARGGSRAVAAPAAPAPSGVTGVTVRGNGGNVLGAPRLYARGAPANIAVFITVFPRGVFRNLCGACAGLTPATKHAPHSRSLRRLASFAALISLPRLFAVRKLRRATSPAALALLLRRGSRRLQIERYHFKDAPRDRPSRAARVARAAHPCATSRQKNCKAGAGAGPFAC